MNKVVIFSILVSYLGMIMIILNMSYYPRYRNVGIVINHKFITVITRITVMYCVRIIVHLILNGTQ